MLAPTDKSYMLTKENGRYQLDGDEIDLLILEQGDPYRELPCSEIIDADLAAADDAADWLLDNEFDIYEDLD